VWLIGISFGVISGLMGLLVGILIGRRSVFHVREFISAILSFERGACRYGNVSRNSSSVSVLRNRIIGRKEWRGRGVRRIFGSNSLLLWERCFIY
jgi:hypothetical protein